VPALSTIVHNIICYTPSPFTPALTLVEGLELRPAARTNTVEGHTTWGLLGIISPGNAHTFSCSTALACDK